MKVIDDLEFYRGIEAEVRSNMKKFETSLVEVAKKAVKEAGFEIGSYPVEGYYYETQELTTYFKCIRTLQEKLTEKKTQSIKKLHNIYTHKIFGLNKSRRTALDMEHGDPDLAPVTVSPVRDPVYYASKEAFEKEGKWTIDNIMKSIDLNNLGTCLVGLAVLVDNINKGKKYNPLATCLACETTVLSREKVCAVTAFMPKSVDWRVSKRVEDYGKEVVSGYNDLFGKNNFKGKLNYVTPDNIEGILKSVDSIIRCVNLNCVDDNGRKSFYHWAIKPKQKTKKDASTIDAYKVVDFMDSRIVTTKDWREITN
ncbi:hypothetical protein HYX19_01385 [Candidatus Woesearchaeota archaeon]|nr:hypothetical protein [Candidatus Woesearchaeota archaeon]